MNCNYCKKPVILVPSAAERAAKYGGKAKDYTNLFPYHSQCLIGARAKETSALIRRINQPTPA